MAMTVFLRGVNVGGHRKFQPSVLAEQLAKFEVVSHGAAGTFIVYGRIAATSLRKEILRRLPFEAEVMICTAKEVADLIHRHPFGARPAARNMKFLVSILQSPPRACPRLPIYFPGKDDWGVRVVRLVGRFACSVWRRRARGFVYPNEVVEKTFGVPSTTRGWDTMTSVWAKLQTGGS